MKTLITYRDTIGRMAEVAVKESSGYCLEKTDYSDAVAFRCMCVCVYKREFSRFQSKLDGVLFLLGHWEKERKILGILVLWSSQTNVQNWNTIMRFIKSSCITKKNILKKLQFPYSLLNYWFIVWKLPLLYDLYLNVIHRGDSVM